MPFSVLIFDKFAGPNFNGWIRLCKKNMWVLNIFKAVLMNTLVIDR